MNLYKKLFPVLFLFPLFSIAQTNFKPGYVVTLKGDTLRGYIDYKEWYKNPKSVNFKTSVNENKVEHISPQSSTAFAVTGLEYYQRFIVSISQDNVDIDHLAAVPDTSIVIDTVFLKIATKGQRLVLFRYNDEIKPRFYILEAGSAQPQELVYHAYYKPEESGSVVYINRFRTQLENLAQKYNNSNEKLSSEILAAKYNEGGLIKIVQTLNGASTEQLTPQNLTGIRWFAGAGINYSNFKYGFTQSAASSTDAATTGSSTFPRIVAGLDFFVNKNTQRLLLRADLSFTMNKFSVALAHNTNNIPSTGNLGFSQYNTALTPQIIFNFYSKDDLKLFAGAGVSVNYSFYGQKMSTVSYNGFATYQNAFPDLSALWFAFPIKVGVQVNKKIELSICYVPSSSISDDLLTSGDVWSVQAGINYLFGK